MFKVLKERIPRRFKRQGGRALQNLTEGVAYRFARNRPGESGFRHIVFVCKGNICRSAFAENYLRKMFPHADLRIESCGLDCDQGNVAPPEAIKVGNDFGVDLNLHRSKKLAAADLRSADLVVAMEYGHLQRLLAMFPDRKRKILLLKDFAPWPNRLFPNIYDPFGLEENEFRRCFRDMKNILDRLMANSSTTR